jgi:hypothetical protein
MYKDIVSLYPYTQYYGRYPVGHPEVVLNDFNDIRSYYGLVKCKVLPPRGLLFPVLPYKCQNRLMFPLCAKCTETLSKEPCSCSEEERMLSSTWTTDELFCALDRGYQIKKIYEIYHWSKSMKFDKETGSKGLFTDYVNCFLQIKMQASGYPPEVVTEQQKGEYIAETYERYGFRMDKNLIKVNKGLRSVAKINLNGFWGKFSQRSGLKNTEYIYEGAQLIKMIGDRTQKMTDFHIISENAILVETVPRQEYIPVSDVTNLMIGIWTTSQARLTLLGYMEKVGDRCLYTDTDSIIYSHKPGQYDIPTSNYLGGMSNELEPEQFITEFTSAGPKNYSFKLNYTPLKDGTRGPPSAVCKVRGFRLNVKNSQLINFDTMTDLVKKFVQDGSRPCIVTVNPQKMTRSKKHCEIVNVVERKRYSVVYVKRRVLDNFKTLPYGY